LPGRERHAVSYVAQPRKINALQKPNLRSVLPFAGIAFPASTAKPTCNNVRDTR
jgi:hypothetical protein